jgi:hypothetical protein
MPLVQQRGTQAMSDETRFATKTTKRHDSMLVMAMSSSTPPPKEVQERRGRARQEEREARQAVAVRAVHQVLPE